LQVRRNLKFEEAILAELDRLEDEACQLLAITIVSRKTARANSE
jgi:hypothetical protein